MESPNPTSSSGPRLLGIFIPALLIGILYAGLNLGIGALLGSAASRAPFVSGALVHLISGAVLCLALAPFSLNSHRSRVATALSIWAAITLVRTIGTGIEGALFRPAPVSQVVAGLILGTVVALITAWCIVYLLPPRPGASSTQPLGGFRWSWVWGVLLAGLAYIVFYFLFGSANALLYTLPFYRDNPQYGLNLPPVGTVMLAQLIRGPLFGLGSLIMMRLVDPPRRATALWLGLLLFVIGGFSPYVENVFLVMPIGFSIATLIELFLQNVSTGFVAARIFKRPPPPSR